MRPYKEYMQTYTIDGMIYRIIENTTMANDFYVMKQLRESGLADLLQTDMTPENLATGIIAVAVDSGIPLALLGGIMLPEGIPDEQWTPEHAAATAARLAIITAPEDKAQIQNIIVGAVAAFFAAGLLSLKPFLHASEAEKESSGETRPNNVVNFSTTMATGVPLSVN